MVSTKYEWPSFLQKVDTNALLEVFSHLGLRPEFSYYLFIVILSLHLTL